MTRGGAEGAEAVTETEMACESGPDNDNPIISGEFGTVGNDSLLNRPLLEPIVLCRNKFLPDFDMSAFIPFDPELDSCISEWRRLLHHVSPIILVLP